MCGDGDGFGLSFTVFSSISCAGYCGTEFYQRKKVRERERERERKIESCFMDYRVLSRIAPSVYLTQ